MRSFICAVVIVSLASGAACPGAEEPAELKRARTEYEKEMEKAARPIRERYVRTLTDIKKALAKKGDVDAVTLIDQEISLVVAGGFPAFAGDWAITYDNGAVRHYSISAQGEVAWTDYSPAKKSMLIVDRGGYVLDFADGKIERLTPTGSSFSVEHFDPAGKLEKGDAGLSGKAKRSKQQK